MFETNVTIQGHERIDFDKKKIRKAMRLRGRDIQKEGRRLIARRAISAPGENPGKQTGKLWRAIKYKVSRSGFLVRIAPYKTAEMKDFYPAFLYYGSSRGLKKRGNYMEEANENRREVSRANLLAALQDSLIPRK